MNYNEFSQQNKETQKTIVCGLLEIKKKYKIACPLIKKLISTETLTADESKLLYEIREQKRSEQNGNS